MLELAPLAEQVGVVRFELLERGLAGLVVQAASVGPAQHQFEEHYELDVACLRVCLGEELGEPKGERLRGLTRDEVHAEGRDAVDFVPRRETVVSARDGRWLRALVGRRAGGDIFGDRRAALGDELVELGQRHDFRRELVDELGGAFLAERRCWLLRDRRRREPGAPAAGCPAREDAGAREVRPRDVHGGFGGDEVGFGHGVEVSSDVRREGVQTLVVALVQAAWKRATTLAGLVDARLDGGGGGCGVVRERVLDWWRMRAGGGRGAVGAACARALRAGGRGAGGRTRAGRVGDGRAVRPERVGQMWRLLGGGRGAGGRTRAGRVGAGRVVRLERAEHWRWRLRAGRGGVGGARVELLASSSCRLR